MHPLSDELGEPKTSKTMIADRYIHLFFILPIVIVLVVTSIIPLFYTLYLSFFKWNPMTDEFPIFNYGRNYPRLINDHMFRESLLHIVLYVLTVVAVEAALGLGVALAVSEERKPFIIARTILIIPMVLAPVVVGILWRIIFNVDYGLLNYFLGFLGMRYLFKAPSTALASCMMVDMWMYTPYMVVLFVAGLKSLPVEPFDAAKVDGASRWQIFRHVTLPMLKPIIVVAILLRSLAALKVFDLIYVLTFGGPGTSSEVLTMTIYKTGFKWVHMGYGAAMSWLNLIIVAIPAMYFITRYLIGGK